MKTNSIRVLGVDTSLRSTGYGVVEGKGNRFSVVEYGTIKNPRTVPLSGAIEKLGRAIGEIIDRSKPDAVSIEGVFFCKNVKTTLMLGEARGVVIAACAARGVPVYEYAPRRVKQSVVGFGGADKSQVVKMVMRLLALREEPQEDAADAMAIAVCHLHSQTGVAALMPKPI